MAVWSSVLGGGRHSQDAHNERPALGLLGVLIAPPTATLIQMAISRAREFVAHEAAAHIGGNPLALANALRKPEASRRVVPMERADPATAHLFILNPIASGGIVKLFSTHPPTRECITRLEAMAYRRTRATA